MTVTEWIDRRAMARLARRGYSLKDAEFAETFLRTRSSTGVAVSETSAMQNSAVFACVRVLAESVASLPWAIFRRVADGREHARDHHLYEILHTRPNPAMSSFTMREATMVHLTLWGNSYWEIQRTNGGDPGALWPLPPSKVKTRLRDNRKEYVIQGTGSYLTDADVLHIPGLGWNGIAGLSPIALSREAVGLALATEEYGARFFGNSAQPAGVLKHPQRMKDADSIKRLEESWAASHQGLSNAHRVAILEEGMEFEKIGIPPEDAQYLETRQFQIKEVSRIFRVPLHLINDLENATFSNIEHQSLEFVNYTLRPWLVRLEQAVNYGLFTETERRVYFSELNVDGLLRGDVKTRYDSYRTGVQWGWLSVNDVRERENMNAVDHGDQYLAPLNMLPADMLEDYYKKPDVAGAPTDENGERISEKPADTALNGAQITALSSIIEQVSLGTLSKKTAKALVETAFPTIPVDKIDEMLEGVVELEPEADENIIALADRAGVKPAEYRSAGRRVEVARSFIDAIKQAAERTVKRERNEVLEAMKRTARNRDVADFEEWINEHYRGAETDYIRTNFEAVFRSLQNAIGALAADEVSVAADAENMNETQREYIDGFLERYRSRSRRQLLAILNEHREDFDEAIEERVDEWVDRRPDKVAREEQNGAASAAARGVWAFAGYAFLRWLTVGDSCPWCESMNGRTVRMVQPFIGNGESLTNGGQQFKPTRAIKHPPLHDGCDCTVVPGGF